MILPKAWGRGTAFILVAAALAVLFVGPPAAAQIGQTTTTVRLIVGDLGPEGRLEPENETAVVAVVAQVRFPSGFSSCAGPMEVLFSLVEAPPYATAVLNPTRVAFNPPFPLPDSRPIDVETRLLITTSRDAPPMQDGLYRVRAETGTGFPPNTSVCVMYSPSTGEGRTAIKNDFVPVLDAEAAKEPLQTVPGPEPSFLVAALAGLAWLGRRSR